MKNKKICPSCAAEYADNLPKCPYCGTLNVQGAQMEYLNKLEDVRRDLEELETVPLQETKKEAARQGKFLKRILLALGVLVLLFAGLTFFTNRESKQDRKAEYLWKQENYPVFDKLYEAEDYEALIARYWEAMENDMPFWEWDHADFCEVLENLRYVDQILEAEAAGEELEEAHYVDLLYYGWKLTGPYSEELSAEEQERLSPYLGRITADFASRWNFTAQERAAFEKEQKENYGYVSFASCETYIEKWMKEKK